MPDQGSIWMERLPMTDTPDSRAALTARLLDAAIEIAAFDGWSGASLRAAERRAGLPAGTAQLLFPGGPIGAITAWSDTCDAAAAAAIGAVDLPAMKVRARVTAGVEARLAAIRAGQFEPGRREAARRAAARLALPDGAPRAARLLWRTADAIWRAIGDTSTDGNFYSKRAILSGVYAQTLGVWFEGDDEATSAFLARRIEDVMGFEKLKAQARAWTPPGLTPQDLAGFAARLRYPRRGA